MKAKLDPLRYDRFANAFVTVANGNATKAAIAAGYSQRTAGVIGSRLLKHPKVRAILERKVAKADLTSQKALERILRIAESEPAKINADHVLKANELILKVNGTLNDRHTEPRVTVNIGFLQQPTGQLPAAIEAHIVPSADK